MSLPMSFDNVPYNNNTYSGDLVITSDVIYYFPHTNLVKERKEQQEKYPQQGILGLWSVILIIRDEISLDLGNRISLNRTRLRKSGLWKDGDSSAVVESNLDKYLSDVKQQPKWLTEFPGLRPIRFAKVDTKNIRISLMGKLVIETKYDQYDFLLGFQNKKMLREALQEGSFFN